jgi:uncharacterized protein
MAEARQIRIVGALTIWAIVCLIIAWIGTWLGYGGRGFAIVLAVLAFLLAGEIFLAAQGVRERIAAILGPTDATVLPLVLIIAYLFYAIGTGNLTWLRVALASAYILAPVIFVLWVRRKPGGTWQDYAAVVLIWLPVELRCLYRVWPDPSAATHTLTILLALNVALVAFLLLRNLEGIGYTIAWGRGFAWAVGFNLLIFAVIAIPLGELIGFIKFGPSLARVRNLPLFAFGVLLFTAWPEELLFRGLIQNLLTKTLHSSFAGLVAASVIFGFAHINNGPFPNWRYVLLATIAGFFYGRAWMKTGSLTASCLVHALVDTLWHTLFR